MRAYFSKTKMVAFLMGLSLVIGLSGCNLLGGNEDSASKSDARKVAQVGNSILYADELQGVTIPGMNPKDSIGLVKNYIDSWVKRELVLNEARGQSQVDQADIKKKVQQFEYDLLRYSLEKQYVTEKLDTTVKKEEVDAYLKSHQGFLKLKENIIQGVFIKIPLATIQRDSLANTKIVRMLMNNGANRKKTLRDYCVKSAEFCHLEDSTWVALDALISNSPFMEMANKTNLLNVSKIQPMSRRDEQYAYYLKLRDFKLADQEAPYEFAKSRIIELILQNRKVQLIKKLEEDLLKKAQKSKKIKIY
ncbi:hypothetical protein BKI52_25935 [marine bacterium AO1-C]|nr:hypothetical protein BKI52_25935 [marine bacterium AO1-C]